MPFSRDVSLYLSNRPLSPRQEAFRHSHVYFANAAREAGNEAGSARQQGHRLLKVPGIASRIAAIRQGMARPL